MVDLFFYLSLDAGLISSQRPSNRVDVAYLHCLPFCMIFTSGDRLHEKITPFFLREDQEFLWAPKLNEDLAVSMLTTMRFQNQLRRRGPWGLP
jgi:hypothetical protein